LIAIIADIHGNLEALVSVLEHIGSAEEVVCLGDIVGYGPSPNECCELIRELDIPTVQGNHDYMCACLEGVEGVRAAALIATHWTNKVLTPANREWLLGLPLQRDYDEMTLIHGGPGTDEDKRKRYVRVQRTTDEEFDAMLEQVPGRRLALGHTHVPYSHGVRSTVFNPGSVGQPRDGDWRSSYATLNDMRMSLHSLPELRQILSRVKDRAEFHRVEYDVKTTLRRMDKAGLPKRIGERLLYGGFRENTRIAHKEAAYQPAPPTAS
jgi:predicted phosphodiesterase